MRLVFGLARIVIFKPNDILLLWLAVAENSTTDEARLKMHF